MATHACPYPHHRPGPPQPGDPPCMCIFRYTRWQRFLIATGLDDADNRVMFYAVLMIVFLGPVYVAAGRLFRDMGWQFACP